MVFQKNFHVKNLINFLVKPFLIFCFEYFTLKKHFVLFQTLSIDFYNFYPKLLIFGCSLSFIFIPF